ncbi:restriction endonuclease subunit S [Helicobacter pylori]|uniref:restriction endonuclease subunit S n=1 Tax=Helicobacter pylori TaxID=210 RepID=UPI001AA6FDA0|nr:restriction endonuclease subunit S [Helicobacter pylori]GHP38510.1 putative type I restriction enzyme specificity protein [Helicobacter pylori]
MDALMLPLNWQRVRLGDIAEINPPTIIPNVFYYIDLENVEKGQLLNKQLMTKNKAPSRARRLLSKNDILYQLVRPYQRNNYFFTLNGNYVASTGYAQIRTLQNPSFLYFALHSNYFVNAVLDRCEGTSYPAISSNELKKCEVILPPLNEQIAIANILSDLDRYLCALDALILKKEGVKKALSFELLSQRKRLKDFNQAWQRVRFGDIGKPCMCKRVMKHQTTRYDEIPFYKIGTFGNTADAFISKKLFLEYKTKYSFPKKGDILISASGTIGKAVIYDGKPAYFQDSNIVWIDNDETLVKNDFLFYAYSNVKWNTEHTTILRLYNDNFRNTLIPLPPLNKQSAIANILSTLDNEIISLKNKKRQFENIKKALNHDLMSAKIRVLKQ